MEESRPPLLDEHAATLAAGRGDVWAATRRYAHGLAASDHRVLGTVLATRPRSGFAVVEEVEQERVVLAGRHRFSRYRLVFELAPEQSGGTGLTILSFAEFPGPHGRAYRALLLRTGAHLRAVRRMLRTIKTEAEAEATGA